MKIRKFFGWALVRNFEMRLWQNFAMESAHVDMLKKRLADCPELEPLFQYIEDHEFRECADAAAAAYRDLKPQTTKIKLYTHASDVDGAPV